MRHGTSLSIGTLIALAMCLGTGSGCGHDGKAEPFGKTFYLDGAGNWGFGSEEVPEGLRRAGYRGDVEHYVWTVSFNPLLDQRDPIGPRIRAAVLADKIKRYCRNYSQNTVNVIALSAGTGVATWAIEALDEGIQVNNLILLGSSLSADYDMSKALKNMTGNIYVYHSTLDWVLDGPVRIVGTIDGKIGVDSVGYSGLKPPKGLEDRVVNIPWTREWIRLGWAGDHTDCTNARFVREEISRHVIERLADGGGDGSSVAQNERL